ncbi:MAG TPA: PEPxxWA-CTERM sorting domain-containing protein [Roseiarcus sp.]
MKSLLLATCATFAILAAAPAAQAIVLAPGASGPPDPLSLGAGSTLVADTGVLPFSNGVFSGLIQEAVYEDTANTFGSGDLTWIIQVANDASSTDAIARVTAGNFATFMTDVGDSGGANAPNLVDRDTPGHTIGFSWASIGGLLAGQTSDFLMIDTNAVRFTTGTLAVIDSQTSDLSAFAPSAVPEPSTWAMMLLGFAGLGFAGYRGSRKSAAFAA